MNCKDCDYILCRFCGYEGNAFADFHDAVCPKAIDADMKTGKIKDSGERTEFESGAVRDMHTGKGRFDLLPMCVLIRLAKHYEAGALKYSDRNWEKGIPAHSFADSAMRHLVKYLDGWNDEDHLIAAIWNLCGLAWTEEKRPEMMDIPAVIASYDIQFPSDKDKVFNNHKWDINRYNELIKACVVCEYFDPLRHACNHGGECDAYRNYMKGRDTDS